MDSYDVALTQNHDMYRTLYEVIVLLHQQNTRWYSFQRKINNAIIYYSEVRLMNTQVRVT